MSDTSTSDPWTVSVNRAAELTGLSKWGIYKLANDGRLETVYSGSRRLVIFTSLRDYIDGLPTERPEASA